MEALSDLAGGRGLFLFLDGIQALRHLNINVSNTNATVLTAGVYKWLCSPEGTGVAYVNREALADINPDTVYFWGVEPTV